MRLSVNAIEVPAALLFGLLACAAPPDDQATTPSPPPAPIGTGRLVVGDIDANDPVRKFEWFKPFADHLAARLGPFDIGHGDVRIAPDIETMSAWLARGEVDLYLDSLYPAMIVCENTGAIPTLRRWKGGAADYHTVFITTDDSDVRSLDQLAGRMLALDDEASTSGFFLPVAHLRSLAMELTAFRSPEAMPAADRVGYVFTGDDENTIQWLLSRRVAAAAIDSITLQRDISSDARERLLILAETEAVPRQVVVTRADLDPDLRQELIALLLQLHETPAGREALASIDTTRFDHFPEGSEEALGRFQATYASVREWLQR